MITCSICLAVPGLFHIMSFRFINVTNCKIRTHTHTHIFLINSSLHRHLDVSTSWLLAIGFSELGSTCISLRYGFVYFGCISRSGIFFCHTVFLFFIFLRELYSIFHGSLYSYQECKNISFSSQPWQHLWFLFNKSHPNRCEVTAHCDFDLHFPDD